MSIVLDAKMGVKLTQSEYFISISPNYDPNRKQNLNSDSLSNPVWPTSIIFIFISVKFFNTLYHFLYFIDYAKYTYWYKELILLWNIMLLQDV